MILIQIAGHLGNDPEERFTNSGQKMVTFRVATNVRRSGKDETVWWRVTIWGDRFAKMVPHLKKGSGVIINGTMQKPEIYTDKNGQTQISLDLTAEMIHFSPFGRTDRQGGAPGGHEGSYGAAESSSSWQQNSNAGGHSPRYNAPSYGAGSRHSSAPAAAAAPFGGMDAQAPISEDEVPF